jgi:aryl-alcohol dehydrogenase-like predicted oxidoreductase
MKYNLFGNTNFVVSNICLGTMTWGKQNTAAEAREQLDYALENGINFIDTAELYAFPPRAETYGKTEEIIGQWLAQNPGKRGDMVLMTKIAGIGMSYIREGSPIGASHIIPSIDASLRRLQTDYIDVYQLHWPNRPNPAFGRHHVGVIDYAQIDPRREEDNAGAVLEALAKAIAAGKIRYAGLSNETAWGVELYLRLARERNLPAMVSLQNEFSLLHTTDWPHVAETCAMHKIAYLPWSPLAGGVLSGKYADGVIPEGSRWTMTNRHGNFRNKPAVHEAVAAYGAIARELGITTSQLALAWCAHFSWVTSTIIGATSMAQLKENIDAFAIALSEDTLKAIAEVQRQFPVPF